MQFKLDLLLHLLLYYESVYGWIHNLKLQNENRKSIVLTRSFGCLKGGTVAVNVTLFSFKASKSLEAKNRLNHTFGFTLDKSRSPSLSSYVENAARCIWETETHSLESIFFKFDLEKDRVVVDRVGEDLQNITITDVPRLTYLFNQHLAHGENPNREKNVEEKNVTGKTNPSKMEPKTQTVTPGGGTTHVTTPASNVAGSSGEKSRKRRDDSATAEDEDKPQKQPPADNAAKDATDKDQKDAEAENKDKKSKTPAKPKPVKAKTQYLAMTKSLEGNTLVYKTHFLVHVKTEAEEGLYNLFFHNCRNDHSLVDLSVQVIQDNNGNYLSADEMPIPAMYFMLSVVFFILTVAWFSVLRKAEEGVYKIHYLMLVVIFFKCVSCLFHGVNLFMIQRSGIHVDTWAILWYIVYLMRGALMFVTILLVGAGWAFIKHVFTDKEKKLFLIVIPLQILGNVAWVIMEESEEGYSSHDTWRKIFIGVDLLCCFTILFPVIWSIRHLQDASKTDGKAAMNLVKLKLFRHYYFLVVSYIYITRIIGYFLAFTLPFHYGWLKDLFTEVFLLVFFILIGCKFRPMSNNPYLQVPLDSDEEEIEMDEVLTKTGDLDTVVRVNQGRNAESQGTLTERQRENSHEYD